MDSAHLMKLCRDAQLIDGRLTRTNIDLIFTKVTGKNSKRLNYRQFLMAIQLFAEKKRMHPTKVMMQVVSIQGPSVSGTVANPNRFHDDKTTYTGVHTQGGPTKHDNAISQSNLLDRTVADVRGVKIKDRVTLPTKRSLVPGEIGVQAQTQQQGGATGGRGYDVDDGMANMNISGGTEKSTPFSNMLSGNLNAEQAKHFTAHDLEEHLFENFCSYNSKTANSPEPQMDSASFVKWNRDLKLIGKGFTTTDCDLIFQKSKAGGNYAKRITFTEFRQVAIPLIAQAKKCSELDLLQRCQMNQGKVLKGTVAQYNKFHDDRSTYTGVHTQGGPTKIDNVISQEMLGNRTVQADIRGVPILAHNKNYTHGDASHGSTLSDAREGKEIIAETPMYSREGGLPPTPNSVAPEAFRSETQRQNQSQYAKMAVVDSQAEAKRRQRQQEEEAYRQQQYYAQQRKAQADREEAMRREAAANPPPAPVVKKRFSLNRGNPVEGMSGLAAKKAMGINHATIAGEANRPGGIYDRLSNTKSFTGVYAKRFSNDPGGGRINGDTINSRHHGFNGDTNRGTDQRVDDISQILRR